ncbi:MULTISPECIES: hypothetical protein [Giesbergeria]|uniref:Uncharacterized protein n=1 Tax=Giesbergeria sinuosa TaxID=80883 RepID=A0ABV9QB70_9BURK
MFQKVSPMLLRLPALFALLLLTGCEIPGLGPSPAVLKSEAEAKAIGSACRHALRGLEDCYTLNPKSPKAAVFAGWKDMDAYMRDNKIEGTPSVLGKAEKPAKPPTETIIETAPRGGAERRS